MIPSARVCAAIEIAQKILDGSSTTRVLLNWSRANRYAGSKDRAAIRDLVFNAIRFKRSSLWPFIKAGFEVGGRHLILGVLYKNYSELEIFFDEKKYSAGKITSDEKAVLENFWSILDQAPLPVRLDFPDFLYPELKRSLGSCLEDTLHSLNTRASVFLRVNNLRCDADEAILSLSKDSILVKKIDGVGGCLELKQGANRIKSSQAYCSGLVEIQDISSQSVIKYIEVLETKSVLDFCAGGGGKVLAIASEMRSTGQYFVYDKKIRRMKDIDARATRAGVKIERFYPNDREKKRNPPKFDLVLADVPCSGTGSWRRNPENKWWLTKSKLLNLIAEQKKIIFNASKYVSDGGIYVYVTCSVLQSENDIQVNWFLSHNNNFKLQRRKFFSPRAGGDGFYVAVMKKQKS
ncbi:MAG: RsmB/NOP family class I SAM-dependent RNA methyltransferase [Pseudomonadota bacterium]|nr:RsmB/NOP family class I SAM-dependent RNA methyltransferase [Pseudomonadota bacterium]